jgi:hypothetical protein
MESLGAQIWRESAAERVARHFAAGAARTAGATANLDVGMLFEALPPW